MLRSQHAQAAQALPATLRQHVITFLLASATALLTAAPSFYEALWPLAWIALVPLFVALRAASLKQALLLGWWAETLMYWVGFYWLIGTMVRFGFIAVPLSLCFFAIIGLGNGIRLGLFAWWLRRTERATYPWWVRLLLPACIYVAFDYLYPRVFPWYLGFLQLLGLPFIQIADIAGVHGVTFVLVVCNTVVVAFITHAAQPERPVRGMMGLACVCLLLLQSGYGIWRMQRLTAAMQQASSLRVALIQPNIGMYEKQEGIDREAQLDVQFGLSAETLDQH